MQGFNPTYPKYLFSQTDTTSIINLNLKLHSRYIDFHIYIPVHLLSQANVTNFFINLKVFIYGLVGVKDFTLSHPNIYSHEPIVAKQIKTNFNGEYTEVQFYIPLIPIFTDRYHLILTL